MIRPVGKTIAIIPSAGLGLRMGGKKKNLLPLLGRPALAHTLKAFEECGLVDSIILVVAPDDIGFCKIEVVERYGFKKVIKVVRGGETRQASVGLGLKEAKGASIIVVHDGARPFVTHEVITRAVKGAKAYGAAITAVNPKDTVKEVRKDGFVRRTIDRERLRLIQTPQAFKADMLIKAHALAESRGLVSTDEASLVEAMGHKVFVVKGSYDNIKITTAEDLVMGECLLNQRVIPVRKGKAGE
jgi:2-C-methyl-D-erythritol 4-phosphate cytidylyltransferase